MPTPISEVKHGDCMDFMREKPDKFWDLAICDPPYGIGTSKVKAYGTNTGGCVFTEYSPRKWDNEIPSQEYFTELFRISKNQIIWGGNYFPLSPSKSWIIWDKQQPEGITLAMAELAWCSDQSKQLKIFRLSASYNNGGCSTDRRSKMARARIHPTQKPVSLYKWLLKNYAKEGDKILDTHGGSFSSRIAAFDMGFEYVGYEKDKDYFEAAEKRFQQHKSQLKLFV